MFAFISLLFDLSHADVDLVIREFRAGAKATPSLITGHKYLKVEPVLDPMGGRTNLEESCSSFLIKIPPGVWELTSRVFIF